MGTEITLWGGGIGYEEKSIPAGLGELVVPGAHGNALCLRELGLILMVIRRCGRLRGERLLHIGRLCEGAGVSKGCKIQSKKIFHKKDRW